MEHCLWPQRGRAGGRGEGSGGRASATAPMQRNGVRFCLHNLISALQVAVKEGREPVRGEGEGGKAKCPWKDFGTTH